MIALIIGLLVLVIPMVLSIWGTKTQRKERKEYVESGMLAEAERQIDRWNNYGILYEDRRHEYYKYQRDYTYVGHMFVTFLKALIPAAVVFFLFSWFFCGIGNQKVVSVSDINNLKALDVGDEAYSNTHGSFFLFLGSVTSESGEETIAKYIEEVSPGMYKMAEVNAEDVFITESGNTPTISYTKYENIKSDTTWSFMPNALPYDEQRITVINVPKDTIISKYNVNG